MSKVTTQPVKVVKTTFTGLNQCTNQLETMRFGIAGLCTTAVDNTADQVIR